MSDGPRTAKGDLLREMESDRATTQRLKGVDLSARKLPESFTVKERFRPGEVVEIKGVRFRVARVGRRTLLLRPIGG